jgi:hypothetical protein
MSKVPVVKFVTVVKRLALSGTVQMHLGVTNTFAGNEKPS